VKRLYRSIMASLSVATYVVMGPLGYLAFALLAVLPTSDRVRRAHRLQGIMRRAFALMHHWLRWVRVMDYNPRQIEGEVPDGPCVVIANHPALDDVTTIMSAIPRLCTAVNRRTFHRRWLRPLLEQAGQFSGGTDTLLGTGAVLDRAIERLQQGFRVLVFPEGHRSPRGRLRPFARGAFEIACRAGVPVVPILIDADPLWLARGDSVLAPPAELAKKRLKVLQPLQPADFDGDSRRMRAHAEAMYSRLLGARVFRSSLPPAENENHPVAEAPQPETGG
jgi:1-acyl-sn-glycerol-3-phosphate acyltransferase